jgi:hypothetical protein
MGQYLAMDAGLSVKQMSLTGTVRSRDDPPTPLPTAGPLFRNERDRVRLSAGAPMLA